MTICRSTANNDFVDTVLQYYGIVAYFSRATKYVPAMNITAWFSLFLESSAFNCMKTLCFVSSKEKKKATS